MMKKALQLLNNLLDLGVRKDTPVIEAQQNYLFNLFLVLATPFALLSLIINLKARVYLPAALNVVQLLIFSIGFLISYTSKFLSWRPILLMFLVFIAVYLAYFFKNAGEYRLLVMMIAAVVVLKKKWQYVLFALLVSSAFVFIRIEEMLSGGLPGSQIFIYILKIGIPLLVFITSLFYFKHIYFRNLLQLEKANIELSHAKLQNEKILYTVAHDLRSPISNIVSISKYLLADTQLDKTQREFLDSIDHSTEISLSLINSLLQANNNAIQKISLRNIDLNRVVKEWLSMSQYMAQKKNISIRLESPDQPMVIPLDTEKMERVFTNLINNAVKFSPEGSVITVRLVTEMDNVILEVCDQGIGIPKEHHNKVFDMYTSAKRNGTAGEKSFGMGLSICKQIVEEHGGAISVESDNGKGTAFIVSLPSNGTT